MKARAKLVLPLPSGPESPITSPRRARSASRAARPAVAASSGNSTTQARASLTAPLVSARPRRRNGRGAASDRLDPAALCRAENRLERGNIGDHLGLRHRIGSTALGGIGEGLQIAADGEGGGIIAALGFAAASAARQYPALRRLRMRLVAHFDPALIAVKREPPGEGRRQHGREQQIGAALEIDQDAQRIAIGKLAAESARAGEDALGRTEQSHRKVELMNAGGGRRPGWRLALAQAPIGRRQAQKFVLAEGGLDLQQGAKLA